MSRALLRSAALCALAGAALSCTPSTAPGSPPPLFSTNWTDDGGKSIEMVRARIGGQRPAPGADIAVAVAGNGDKIVGLPLGGGQKWVFSHALDARPVVAGSLVVAAGGGELFAVDARTGKKVWSRAAAGAELHGAGDDGAVTAVVIGAPGGKSSTLLAIARDGSVVRSIETDKQLGAPAVVAKIAFVPWANQYVSAVDLATGDELGRVVLREKISRAWESGGGLYFGEMGIFRFDEHIREGSHNKATHVSLQQRELPGTPQLMTPGTTKTPPISSAPDRIRLYARPSAPTGPLSLDSGRYYATYFRLVMSFESSKGALSWVHTHTSDVIGGEAVAGGVVLCDDKGKLTVLDARTGGAIGGMEFGEPIKSCVVHADQWHAEGTPRGHESLAAQITHALLDPEPTLATAQRLLLRELAALEDELATKTLVDLASDPRTSPMLIGDARTALANRRNGASFMLEALARHYDYLKDVLRPPPVGPIAQALAAMNERSAAPMLAEHILDPSDTDDDVKQAAGALAVLGTEKEVPALKQFFAMYRASAENDELGVAVANAGQALLKLGGPAGHALIEQAVKDETTSPLAKGRLEAVLQSWDQKNPPAPSAEPAKADAGAPAPPPKPKK